MACGCSTSSSKTSVEAELTCGCRSISTSSARTAARAVIASIAEQAARRERAAADRRRGRRRCSRGSTACCGTRARPASCRTASPAGADDARQPILLSTEHRCPNLARNLLIADGEWRDAALGFERAFYPVRRRHAGGGAAGLEAACRARGGGAPLLGAGGRASGSRRAEPCRGGAGRR